MGQQMPAALAATAASAQLPGMHPHPAAGPYPTQRPDGSAGGTAIPDDGALLARMAGGDEGARGMLYDRWSPFLHALAMQIVGDADDAEEVLEETFWQAWRQADRYEHWRGAVSTWLSMIARSRALDRVRARRRVREDRYEELPEPAEGEGGDALPGSPFEAAADAERRVLVARALAQLPAEQRQTVELAYFRGMSQSEIAEHTGQPLGTVKTRARLALQKLRDTLSVLREDAR
jgi:RNA polymerase sigma-70 factor (ECF subfamily)